VKSTALDEGLDGDQYSGFSIDALKGAMQSAVLGYLRMNVVEPPNGAVWGHFNNRPINHDWTQALCKAFLQFKESCSDAHSMEVALDPKWLADPKAILPTVQGMSIAEVPLMEFNPDGVHAIKKDKLWMLSGNHRRVALKLYVETLQTELSKAKRAVQNITQKRCDDKVTKLRMAPDSTLKEAEDVVRVLEAKIETSCMWTVKVYDRGTWHES
jgi:hypothetical protein